MSHVLNEYLRCTFPRVVDVTDYATVTNRAAQAGTAATGVFSFDLEYFTDASFSMVSTDDDDKIVGETVFFQIVPSDSPGNVSSVFFGINGSSRPVCLVSQC